MPGRFQKLLHSSLFRIIRTRFAVCVNNFEPRVRQAAGHLPTCFERGLQLCVTHVEPLLASNFLGGSILSRINLLRKTMKETRYPIKVSTKKSEQY